MQDARVPRSEDTFKGSAFSPDHVDPGNRTLTITHGPYYFLTVLLYICFSLWLYLFFSLSFPLCLRCFFFFKPSCFWEMFQTLGMNDTVVWLIERSLPVWMRLHFSLLLAGFVVLVRACQRLEGSRLTELGESPPDSFSVPLTRETSLLAAAEQRCSGAGFRAGWEFWLCSLVTFSSCFLNPIQSSQWPSYSGETRGRGRALKLSFT